MEICIDPEVLEWIQNPQHWGIIILITWYSSALLAVRILVKDNGNGEYLTNRVMLWFLSPVIAFFMVLIGIVWVVFGDWKTKRGIK